jgi:hypothetical protein
MTLPKLPLNFLHEDVNKENIYNPAVRLAMKNSLLASNIVLERQIREDTDNIQQLEELEQR